MGTIHEQDRERLLPNIHLRSHSEVLDLRFK